MEYIILTILFLWAMLALFVIAQLIIMAVTQPLPNVFRYKRK